MTKPIRWAVLGVGRFGAIHARAIAQLPGVELAGLCGRREELLDSLSAELGVERVAREANEFLDRPDVDVVSITTHWRDHRSLAVAALKAGKHVLLEKPMACNAEECREILQTAAAADVFLMVGHVCRFDPRVTLAFEAVREGRLGRIVSMHAKRNLRRAPGSLRLDKISPLMGDGIHDADLMLWFLQRLPNRIYARTVRVHDYAYPDLGWAMLEFGDEAVGVVETVWCLPPNVPTTIDARFEVVGTDGMLTVDCSHSGLSILDSEGMRFPDAAYWPVQYGRHVGALSNELAYFADCVRRGMAPKVITPRGAAEAVAVMEAAEISASTGQVVDFVSPY